MNKTKMPWEEIECTDYGNLNNDNIKTGGTIGEGEDIKYGQGKPVRIVITGDITSDNDKG